MDARIGMLNSGKFYAFVNGYDAPEFVGTLAEVETALGIREAAPARKPLAAPAKKIKRYHVAARLVNPSCFNAGYDFTIYSASKSEAISRARNEARNSGHTRQDGMLIYTAVERIRGQGRNSPAA